jgi:HEAT repeat protein
MTKRNFAFILGFMSMLIFAFKTDSIAQPTEEQLNAFRSAKTVRIIVYQFYGEAEDVILPFEEIASRLFQNAGLKVVSADAKEYDVTLFIKVEGKAMGGEYHSMDVNGEVEHSSHHYAGASLKGSIALISIGLPDYKKDFEGNIELPFEVKPNLEQYPTPSSAPFDAALREAGSFISKMIEIIGEIYGSAPLALSLNDKDIDLRVKAAYRLRMLDWSPENDIEQALYFIANNNWNECVEMGKKAEKPLIDALSINDAEMRENASKALENIGWQPQDLNQRIMFFIAKQEADELAKIGTPVVEKLIAALKDDDWGVRKMAADALGKIKDKRAVEPLIGTLSDCNALVRHQAVWSLGEIGDNQAVEPLIAALKDPFFLAKWSAISALAKIKDTRATEPLIDCLKSDNMLIALYANDKLKELTGQDFGDDYDAWSKWWQENKHKYQSKEDR